MFSSSRDNEGCFSTSFHKKLGSCNQCFKNDHWARTCPKPWENVKKLHQQTSMLEHDVDGEGDETKLFKSIVKLFDKALTSFKLQDLEQSIFSMEHADAN
jgi:hypothetical protein